MHTENDKCAGRAIYADGTPSTPSVFSAKDECPSGRMVVDLQALGLGDALRVVPSAGERSLYSRDQSEIPRFLTTFMFKSTPEAVVQPSTPKAAAAVLGFARSRGIAVIPRGAGSSPFGGSTPVSGGLVMDMSRMDKVIEVDRAGRTVTVQAGARWADIDQQLEKHGLCLASSPSSKFSTVGGWVSTGGLGLNSFSRGHFSRSVLALEMALTDGTVRRFSQADPEFATVFGSEGQLGVVTAATIAVKEKPKAARPHLVMFDELSSALSFAKALSESGVKPVHIVFEDANKIVLVNQVMGQQQHLRAAHAVLVNIEGEGSEKAFAEFVRGTGLEEEKEYLARYLWNERFFPMKARRLGPGMLGAELIMPMRFLPDAVATAKRLCSALSVDPLFEVHFLGGGDALLLCFFLVDQGNTLRYTIAAFESLLLARLMIDMGGRPYSIGIWNSPFMDAEDKAKIKELRALKAKLDPTSVMNRGKYFRLSGRFGMLSGLAFHPRFMRPMLRTVIAFSPLTTGAITLVSEFARRRLKPGRRTEVVRAADECAMCGACVSVCPAYLLVGDERVTGRGKLLAAKAMSNGVQISKEHAHRIFLCMRCKACEQVCQSKLDLTSIYDQLEAQLEQVHGKDPKEIEAFVRAAEASPEYDGLIRRGLVLGAPKHGNGGGARDV